MCGIAGFIDFSESLSLQESESVVNRMIGQIQYRGPDDSGLFLDKGIGLGSVRLSIIDIFGGNQPLSNEDDSLWIIYNGEIFNYIELRNDLLRQGHQFKTHTDTEVILHLYEEYGTSSLQYLNGQFAFAIWNTKTKECFFARDRIGIRPLFYSFINGSLVFGSEIKSIFEFPGAKRELFPQALKEVFTFWTTLTPYTVFKNIYEIPPGHYAIFKTGKLKIKKYWSLKFESQSKMFNGDILDAVEQLKYLLRDSLVLRLRSDVQVGAYLSGGLDSSTITSLIKQIEPGILNTFSIGFADNVYDETRYQDEVSQYLQTKHKSITCTSRNISESFPKVIWHTEIPLLRTAPAPMMQLAKLVHESNFKVVITGEGADEAFAGYDIFKETIIRQFWAKQPSSRLRPLLLKKLYPYLPSISNASPEALRIFFKYKLEATDSPIYSHLIRWKNTSNIQKHFRIEFEEGIRDYDPIEKYTRILNEEIEGISSLAKAQLIESNIFLSGYLLSSQGDRVAMAYSVEGRYPFLDYRILEFAASLPDQFKLKGMNEKFILKELMKTDLPQNIIRRSKQAYRSPIIEAFTGNGVPSYVNDLLSERELNNNGIFNPDSVKSLIKKIKNSENISEIDHMSYIGILSTQLLYDLFINNFNSIKNIPLGRSIIRNRVEKNVSEA